MRLIAYSLTRGPDGAWWLAFDGALFLVASFAGQWLVFGKGPRIVATGGTRGRAVSDTMKRLL
jgi:hypothetical protein